MSNKFDGAEITILIDRDRGLVDPEGQETEADYDACYDYVATLVRDAYPGARVLLVGGTGRTAGALEDGTDITSDVRETVRRAYDDWCASP